jgi:5-methylcytosine-specific restriction endonuclease McrA
VIFTSLAGGDVTLTTVTLLAAHLSDENNESLLEAARHQSKRDVERLVAALVPQPDIASSLRRRPSAPSVESARLPDEAARGGADPKRAAVPDAPARLEWPSTSAAPEERDHARRAAMATTEPRAVLAPLAADRYLLKITLSAEARARLDRARDLLRHVVPSGDPAVIVDRALTVLLERLEKSRRAAARRPQAQARVTSTGRHVPASVRRAVWARDDGRCAFVGTDGRCRETGWLELHHVVPFARGGPTTADNLELRCRAHNAYDAEREFGRRGPLGRSGAARPRATLSGQSSAGGASR